MEINKPIGIDLGTTNSSVGIMNDTESQVILPRDRMGLHTTPSCIWYDRAKNEIVVGKRAFRRSGSRPAPIRSIKRKMGTMLLTPLGVRGSLPGNLPPLVARALGETAEQRLQRYLERVVDDDPQLQEAKRSTVRQDPPAMWVLDQQARLDLYLETIDDERDRAALADEAPLLWLPEEISALILAELRRQMSQTLDDLKTGNTYHLDRAVITVPAYFGSEQIEATKEAGGLSGLEVLELIQEPSSAARYYCWKEDIADGNFMVFDLGGGTFDVSIVRRTAGVFDVLGISGNNFLGGDDLDGALGDWIRRNVIEDDPDLELRLEHNDEEDTLIENRFRILAEGVKKSLTRDPETLLQDMNTIRDRSQNMVPIDMVVTRDMLDEIAGRTLFQCLPKCWEALAKAKIKADVSLKDMDVIFLVGGATHMPLVRQMVREAFCCHEDAPVTASETDIASILDDVQGDDEASTERLHKAVRDMMANGERARCSVPKTDDPDLCVANGAAIRAASYGTRTRDAAAAVHIELLGSRGTKSMQVTVKGRAWSEDAGLLEGAAALITHQELGFEDETPLAADGAFVFRRVPLDANTRNELTVQIALPDGRSVAQTHLVIEQSSDYAEISSGIDTGPTLSKAVYIDVKSAGRLHRRVLIESNASLPTEQRQVLRVPHPNTGSLKFRLYQGRRHLKTIVATIDPTLPPETPIEFSLAISEDHLMRARYKVGREGTLETAVVEPPPPETPPSPAEVEAQSVQIEEALSHKSEVAAQIYRNKVNRIRQQLSEARSTRDSPKLIDAFHELKDVGDNITQADRSLEPPWEEFDRLLKQCRELLEQIEEQKEDYPVDRFRKTLDTQRNEAWTAYQDQDQQLYGEKWTMLRGHSQGLRDQLRPKEGGTSQTPSQQARQRVVQLLDRCNSLLRGAETFVPQFAARARSSANENDKKTNQDFQTQCVTAATELAECRAKLEELRLQCVEDPQLVLGECDYCLRTLEQWRVVLVAKHNILTGCVAEDDSDIPWE